MKCKNCEQIIDHAIYSLNETGKVYLFETDSDDLNYNPLDTIYEDFTCPKCYKSLCLGSDEQTLINLFHNKQ